jgi:hypothetical protein
MFLKMVAKYLYQSQIVKLSYCPSFFSTPSATCRLILPNILIVPDFTFTCICYKNHIGSGLKEAKVIK